MNLDRMEAPGLDVVVHVTSDDDDDDDDDDSNKVSNGFHYICATEILYI